MEIGILSALLNWHCGYNVRNIRDVYWDGDVRPCHHACAVQQWRHRM